MIWSSGILIAKVNLRFESEPLTAPLKKTIRGVFNEDEMLWYRKRVHGLRGWQIRLFASESDYIDYTRDWEETLWKPTDIPPASGQHHDALFYLFTSFSRSTTWRFIEHENHHNTEEGIDSMKKILLYDYRNPIPSRSWFHEARDEGKTGQGTLRIRMTRKQSEWR